MDGEGFELSLLRAAVVATGTDLPHLTNIIGNNGVLSAALCLRCEERLSAIIRHKLQDPCPTCEIAPMALGDERADARAYEMRRAV